jgi:hypothetical protein
MKLKSILLFLLAIALFLFGNREFWEKYIKSKEDEKEAKLLLAANTDVEKRFEIQKLKYDSVSRKWSNPNFYFQVINVGKINFKALKKNKTTIETDTDENASESQ